MKATPTHIRIFERGNSVTGATGSTLYPLFGAPEYRSVRTLENKGFGRIVASSKNRYHNANNFFVFNEGFRYNWVTHNIESV